MTLDQEIKHLLSHPVEEQDGIIQGVLKAREQPSLSAESGLIEDSDNLDPKDDRLQRYPMAQVIADLIVKNKKISTYSIEGDWGSGKTNVMRWVMKELNDKHRDQVIPIWFDPWKYESAGNIVIPLLRQLKPSGIRIFLWIRFRRVVKEVMVLGGVEMISRYLGLKKTFEAFYERRKVEGNINNLSNLHGDFKKLIERILHSRKLKTGKIVFLIEDLDRCAPDNVVLLLESIKNFLKIEGTCFVFAIDRHVISQGIKVKYGNLTEIDGNEYLEKIIDLSFELPFNTEDCALQLLRTYDSNKAFPMGNIEFAPKLFSLAGVKSIRFIKKVFNRYILLYTLAFRTHHGSFSPQIFFFLTFCFEHSTHLYHLIERGQSGFLTEIMNKGWHDPERDDQFVKLPFANQTFIREVPNSFGIRLVILHFLNQVVLVNTPDNESKMRKSEQFQKDLALCVEIFNKLGQK
jgi:hypothetical protein